MKSLLCFVCLSASVAWAAGPSKWVVGNGSSDVCARTQQDAIGFATVDALRNAEKQCEALGDQWEVEDHWQLPGNETTGNPRDSVQCTPCTGSEFKCTVKMLPQACTLMDDAARSRPRLAANGDWKAKRAPPASFDQFWAAQCKVMVQYRDTQLVADLDRAAKSFGASSGALGTLAEMQRESRRLRGQQPTVNAAYQLALGLKTVADTVNGILKLVPANALAFNAAIDAADTWATRLLKLDKAITLGSELTQSATDWALKDAVSKVPGVGGALVSTYKVANDLYNHTRAYREGNEILDVMDASLLTLEREIRKVDAKLRESQFQVETVNRMRRDTDQACNKRK